jgi:hypothetical protein
LYLTVEVSLELESGNAPDRQPSVGDTGGIAPLASQWLPPATSPSH